MGILIAVEGTDSSGKQTQSELLRKTLSERGIRTRLVSFPAYESDSSALVKMYLNGEFGEDPNEVNAYAASAFYAVDRYATFKKDWGADYAGGTVIVADRYVPSNLIHQAAKIDDAEQKRDFAKWLSELEYDKFGLPRPDVSLFLDMPVETAGMLMAERANKIDNSGQKDIHERNSEYLKKSYDNAKSIAESMGWKVIPCTDKDGNVRSISDIADEIAEIAVSLIKKSK